MGLQVVGQRGKLCHAEGVQGIGRQVQFRVDFTVVEAERRPGDPACLVAQADKIRRLTNWQPRYNSLQTIVEDAWRWENKLAGR